MIDDARVRGFENSLKRIIFLRELRQLRRAILIKSASRLAACRYLTCNEKRALRSIRSIRPTAHAPNSAY